MANASKIKKDMTSLSKQMLKMGFDLQYLNQFWSETVEEVKKSAYNSARDETTH